jgi:hypothetical protein
MACGPVRSGAGGAGAGGAAGAQQARADLDDQRWPILVVCPTAVVANWQQEFGMWGCFQVGGGGRGRGAGSRTGIWGAAESERWGDSFERAALPAHPLYLGAGAAPRLAT